MIFGDHTKAVKYVDFDFVAGADGIKILCPKSIILPKFFFYILRSLRLPDLGYSRHFKELKEKEIPLPPIEIQQQIVDEMDGYQKVIDGCRQVVENYTPSMDNASSWNESSDFEIVKLIDYVKFQKGTSITKKEVNNGSVPVIAGGKKPAYFHDQENRKANSITISSSGSAGFVSFHPYPIFASDCFTVSTASQNLDQKFLFYLLESRQEEIYKLQSKSTLPHIYPRDFNNFEIPLPPVEVQQKIVEELDECQKTMKGNENLIKIYNQKIQDRISKVWGE